MIGPTARTISTSVGAIEAAVLGEGPAVIIVHGMPGSWRQALPLALDLADDHTVVLPSRPGYGATPVRTGRDPFEQAAAYVALLDALELADAAVVGISGGGPSGSAFAQEHPDRTRSLVLCCALAPHLTTLPAVMRWGYAVPGLAELVWALNRRRDRARLDDHAALDAWIAGDLTDAERARFVDDPSMRTDLIGFLQSRLETASPHRGMRNDLRSMGFGAPASPLDRVSAPTVVIHGDTDPVVPLKHGEWYASQIAGARLEVLEGAGHAFLLTFRPVATQLIRDAIA